MRSKGEWEAEYPAILRQCASSLTPEQYMQVLRKENEVYLLLREVAARPGNVLTYGDYLAKEYPEETYSLFHSVITKQAAEANDRGKYSQVSANLRKYFEAGGVAGVADLIEEFRVVYKRRPAMLDELDKLEKKLKKINK